MNDVSEGIVVVFDVSIIWVGCRGGVVDCMLEDTTGIVGDVTFICVGDSTLVTVFAG